MAPGCIRLFFSHLGRKGTGPAVFLDRDGVINEKIHGGYVTHWDSFRFVPGITEAVRTLSATRLPIIVVSNQAGVGKGSLSRFVLGQLTRRFVHAMRSEGARIDAVYYCPHTPEAGCGCRKPRPGLLQQAARDWGVDLAASVMVGDSESDAEAANAVGCRAVLLSPKHDGPSNSFSAAEVVRCPAEIPPIVVSLLAHPPAKT